MNTPGTLRRARHLLAELADVVRGLTPARRRARYGDIDFDCDHRVDTTAAGVGLATRLRGVLAGSQYQPADPVLFHQSLDALPIDFRRYLFIDAGSGKGRALLMACRYPFRRVLGIEVVPELHAIAQRNLAGFHSPGCAHVESWLGDARAFPWPPEPTVLFLFHPFPEWVLAQVMERLRNSLEQNPRKLWLVYHNPVSAPLLARMDFLRQVSGTLQAATYTNHAPEP
jgi:hypothetical protein